MVRVSATHRQIEQERARTVLSVRLSAPCEPRSAVHPHSRWGLLSLYDRRQRGEPDRLKAATELRSVDTGKRHTWSMTALLAILMAFAAGGQVGCDGEDEKIPEDVRDRL